MKTKLKPIGPFLAGVMFTALGGLLVWLAAPATAPRVTVAAKTQDSYQLPTRGQVCALGNLHGSYVFALDGVIVNGEVKQFYAGIGVLALDGQGGAQLRLNQSYDGRLTGATVLLGRYTLGEDCAGQLLFASGARFDFVSDNGGRELRLLQTNPNNVIQGTAKRQ